jgi:hypothetical protein
MIMGISGWLKIALFSAGSELAEMGNTLGRRVHGQWWASVGTKFAAEHLT